MAKNGRFSERGKSADPSARIRPQLAEIGQLLSQGRGRDALPLAEKAVAEARGSGEAAHMLGVCHLQSGQLAQGIEALKKALLLAPSHPPLLNHLGVALCQAGRANDGIAMLQKAARLAPDMGDIRNNLAHALNEAGDFKNAALHYKAVVGAAPHLPQAWQGYASALHKSGDNAGALAAIDDAIARFPGLGSFLASRGRILLDLNRKPEAEAALQKALALDPTLGDAANNLGTLLEAKGQLGEARVLFERATRLKPDLADAWFNLASGREKIGDLDGARADFRQCLALRPDSARTLAALISVRRKLCDWPGLDAEIERLESLIANPAFPEKPADAPPPFGMLSLMLGSDVHLRVARVHSAETAAKASLAGCGPFASSAGPMAGRKIRVGYLSPDFREHPVAQLMAGVIEAHDREQFEISAWSLGPDDASPWRRRIFAGADRFDDLREMSVAESVALMRAAELDIIVDLAGYTAHARPEILAARAAPIQVNYLGYPGTMGASFVDFIIGDATVIPPGDEQFYAEHVMRIADCYQANDNRAEIDKDPVSRVDAGLPEDAFVFCSFSMNYKIDPPVLDAWSEILRKTPGAVLWLFRTDKAAAENILKEAAARGIADGRIIFADRKPKAKHLARHRLADLFLDTFAYGAHTTASDALWAGLPVLTLEGDTFARRVGASIVRAAGMGELVTGSVAEYTETASRIGSDRREAERLKARLAEARPSCPLFDTPAIAGKLEAAYREMLDRSAGATGAKKP